MFKKLISNLPFNPALIHQVAFYAKRVHAEESLRRTGVILVVLSMFVQMFAVVSPPEPTLAQSDNDIIYGGFSTQSEAIDHCNGNTQQFKTILNHFNVTCDDIANSSKVSVKSTDYDKQLYSMGRKPLGPVGRNDKPTDEHVQTINGTDYYMRHLWAWDSGSYSTYDMLKGTNKDGQTFFIMFNCGNIVWIGKYEKPLPPPPPPSPPPAPTEEPDPCPLDSTILADDPKCKPCPYDETILRSDSDCVECPYDTSIKASDPGCQPPPCPLDPSISSEDARCEACPYDTELLKDDPGCARCPYPGLRSISETSDQCYERCPRDTSLAVDDPACEPCPYNSNISIEDDSCKPCESSQDQNDLTACLVLSKTASNKTQDIENADGTTANGGDVIIYKLSVNNTSPATVNGFTIQENISDVLEYAEIIELNDGLLDEDSNIVRWENVTIGPNDTTSREFTVRIKNPVPQTPVSSSDPNAFDLEMINVYGDTVKIKLPPTVMKTTEQVVRTLPDTGPGANMIMTTTLTIVVSYFFARARLMRKELAIIRQEFTAAGGY